MASKLQKEFPKKKYPIGTKKEMGTKDIFKKMIGNVIQIFFITKFLNLIGQLFQF